ncbi:helix-turn-helix domain-containing protein [Microvirga sp. CF3016]|uniref:helix-turn-helix domain-containing protein n=1 Tax=Microvirga sp. CF3016 TaxID=3110181 RepID=UPI002E7A42C6|nr:helix-turn-helix transcriptional regulator [Microvirga sp. CF3016]MEE1613335.1 helix-turn-helix transcriptional regulator [Microvirga sp. CF3016]
MSVKSLNRVDRHVGARIRLRRSLTGVHRAQLGRILGLTLQDIQKFEAGRTRVGAGHLLDIANVLGVPVSYFLEGLPYADERSDEGTAIQLFLNTSEGLELASAFTRIENPVLRRVLLDLVRAAAPRVNSQM